MTAKSERLLTTAALAREIGVCPDTIRLWVRRGVLAPRKTTAGTSVFTDADLRAARQYVARRAA